MAEDLEKLNRFARARGFDFLHFIEDCVSGNDLSRKLSPDMLMLRFKSAVTSSLNTLAPDLALPVAGCVIVRSICGRGTMDRVMNLLCALCCASSLTLLWTDGQRQLTTLIDGLIEATGTLTPALVSASALAGGSFWPSAAASLSALCALFLDRMLRDWGLKLCGMAAMAALCCAVAGRNALSRLFDLAQSAARWLLASAMFIYGALVSAQGIAGASLDGAAMRAARSAIESVVPVIGGGVSDAAGSIAGSIGAAKGVIGIAGVALLLHMCLMPLLRIGTNALALRLVAATTEPLADGAVSELTGRFGALMETLFAIGVCAVAMAAMLPTCCAVIAVNLQHA